MKEATGEVSMTMVTIVAIAVIGGILALLWPQIQKWISNSFGSASGTAGSNQEIVKFGDDGKAIYEEKKDEG